MVVLFWCIRARAVSEAICVASSVSNTRESVEKIQD